MADTDDVGGNDDHAEQSATVGRRAGLHLPARRKASPWTKRVLIAILVALVLSVPLWIDPMTLRVLLGHNPAPTLTATPTPAAVEPVP